ncbi:MAG: hypothetical protein JWQ54_1896 [Mucilaginibacter sp.]|nr:hypothetical protein [Mucilaginibacter sp.]
MGNLIMMIMYCKQKNQPRRIGFINIECSNLLAFAFQLSPQIIAEAAAFVKQEQTYCCNLLIAR